MPAFSNRFKAYSFLLLNSALWGFAVPIIKYSLDYTSPATFLFYRFVIATIIFFPIFLFYKAKIKHQKINIQHHLLLALLGTPLTLLPFFYGLMASTAIESSIIESTGPIFVILGGLAYLREKVSRKEWFGTLIALAGTLLLVLEPFFLGHSIQTLSIKGNLLIVFSNLIWATFLLLSKKDHVDPIYLSFFSFLISIPFFLFIVINQGQGFGLPTSAIPGILYMAIGGSIVAFWAYQEGQKRIEASEAAIFSYLKPLFAIPLSVLWLKEGLTATTILATLIIVIGVLLSESHQSSA